MSQRPTLHISLSRMNKVVEVHEDDFQAIVEPGVGWVSLNKVSRLSSFLEGHASEVPSKLSSVRRFTVSRRSEYQAAVSCRPSARSRIWRNGGSSRKWNKYR
jgi:hypothetical protein